VTRDEFSDWFVANYPVGTIIGDPYWHVPCIWGRVNGSGAQEWYLKGYEDALAMMKQRESDGGGQD
jgi:hypothetical protein